MKLGDIVNILEATVHVGQEKMQREIDRAGASDLMSDILAALSDNSVLLTGLVTIQAIRTAVVAGVGAVVFVRGKNPSQEVVDLATAQGVPLLTTPYSMFVSCGRLYSQGFAGLDGAR